MIDWTNIDAAIAAAKASEQPPVVVQPPTLLMPLSLDGYGQDGMTPWGRGLWGIPAVTAFETLVGRSVDGFLDFVGAIDPAHLATGFGPVLNDYAAYAGKKKLRLKISTCTSEKDALGNYAYTVADNNKTFRTDAAVVQIVTAAIKAGFADLDVVLDWEETGGWYPHNCYPAKKDASGVTTVTPMLGEWITNFDRHASNIRNISGFKGNIVVCHAARLQRGPPPQPKNMTVYGLDFYNDGWVISTPAPFAGPIAQKTFEAAKWTKLISDPFSLIWHEAQAAALKLPLHIYEAGSGDKHTVKGQSTGTDVNGHPALSNPSQADDFGGNDATFATNLTLRARQQGYRGLCWWQVHHNGNCFLGSPYTPKPEMTAAFLAGVG